MQNAQENALNAGHMTGIRNTKAMKSWKQICKKVLKMRGYNSIKQFVEDYNLLRAAKKIEPGREGETISSYMKKLIEKKLNNSSKQFKILIKKKNYTKFDLMIIATHDSIHRIRSLEQFARECFSVRFVKSHYLGKIVSSSAFKSGRLKRLYEFIPSWFETKNDIVKFLKRRRNITNAEFQAILKQTCPKWKKWIDELIEKGKIHYDRGRWYA